VSFVTSSWTSFCFAFGSFSAARRHDRSGTMFVFAKPVAVKPGPHPHQQQCRSNVRHRCQKRQQCRTSFALKFRPFDKVERCFDIVAGVDRALRVYLDRCRRKKKERGHECAESHCPHNVSDADRLLHHKNLAQVAETKRLGARWTVRPSACTLSHHSQPLIIRRRCLTFIVLYSLPTVAPLLVHQ